MNNKSSITEKNSPENSFDVDEEYMKLNDIKCEPKDSDDFSNEGQEVEIQNFHFVSLDCIKIEKNEEENADDDLEPKYVYNASEINGTIANFEFVDSCDGKNFRMNNVLKNLEYVGIKVEKTYKSDETDSSRGNFYNTNQNESSFICGFCKRAFTTSEYCNNHIRRCRNRVYTQASTSSDNVSVTADMNKTPKVKRNQEGFYQCNQCEYKFQSRDGLNKHLRTHSGVGLHTCRECNKQFTVPSYLTRHMIIHTKEKPHKCTQCKAAFNDPGVLKKHMLTHSGLRPHKCTRCGKSFTQSCNLTRHMRIHTFEKPYQCTQCFQSFTASNTLKRHMKTHSDD